MRVQADHWAVILDFAEQHPEIITNKTKSLKGREVLQQSWQELTVMLNSLGMGERKTEEWKRTIIDWKSKTKAKAVTINTHLVATGGGPPPNSTLTSYEERLLALMGKVAVEGNPCIKEVGLKRPISSTTENEPQVSEQRPFKQLKISSNPIFLSLSKEKCRPFSISGTQKQPIIAAEQQRQPQKSCQNIPPTTKTSLGNINIITSNTISTSQQSNSASSSANKSKRGDSRARDTLLGQQLHQMNKDTLEVLQSIDNRMSKISDHFGELIEVIRDLKK